jgi:hypothetical protein
MVGGVLFGGGVVCRGVVMWVLKVDDWCYRWLEN